MTGLTGVSLCIANISGVVTDTGTTPIVGAVVQLEKGGQIAITGADGSFTLAVESTGILPVNDKLLPSGLSARISDNLMAVTIVEQSFLEIAMFDLNGKSLSTFHKTLAEGSHSISLPYHGAGVYLYKVKSGNREIVLKRNSISGVASRSFSAQWALSKSLPKQAKAMATINDVITSTKDGYLNYRCVQNNSDTSGIIIKMIENAGNVTDADGNMYQSVRIGNQVWITENLRVTKYNDGSAITKITSNLTWDSLFYTTIPAYCYYNNTTNADSIKKFGALYNWYAVDTKKLAPAGWHVPTDSEWTIMENYLVLHGFNWDGTTDASYNNKIAKSLAAKTYWLTYSNTGTIGCIMTMNNISGFSALPGGFRFYTGHFSNQSRNGYWWSATEYSAGRVYSRYLFCDSDYLCRNHDYEPCGFSVRLVKD